METSYTHLVTGSMTHVSGAGWVTRVHISSPGHMPGHSHPGVTCQSPRVSAPLSSVTQQLQTGDQGPWALHQAPHLSPDIRDPGGQSFSAAGAASPSADLVP